eukprot:scaffold22650_cov28-Tisochrysis_lutea.AAC.1
MRCLSAPQLAALQRTQRAHAARKQLERHEQRDHVGLRPLLLELAAEERAHRVGPAREARAPVVHLGGAPAAHEQQRGAERHGVDRAVARRLERAHRLVEPLRRVLDHQHALVATEGGARALLAADAARRLAHAERAEVVGQEPHRAERLVDLAIAEAEAAPRVPPLDVVLLDEAGVQEAAALGVALVAHALAAQRLKMGTNFNLVL